MTNLHRTTYNRQLKKGRGKHSSRERRKRTAKEQKQAAAPLVPNAGFANIISQLNCCDRQGGPLGPKIALKVTLFTNYTNAMSIVGLRPCNAAHRSAIVNVVQS